MTMPAGTMKNSIRKFAAKMGIPDGVRKMSMNDRTRLEIAKKEFDARIAQSLKQESVQLRKQLRVLEALEGVSNDHGQHERIKKPKTPEQIQKKRLRERQARRKKRALHQGESTPWLVGDGVES